MATAVLYISFALLLVVALVVYHMWFRNTEAFQSPSCTTLLQTPKVLVFTGTTPEGAEDLSGSTIHAKAYRIPSSVYAGYDRLAYVLVGGGSSGKRGKYLNSLTLPSLTLFPSGSGYNLASLTDISGSSLSLDGPITVALGAGSSTTTSNPTTITVGSQTVLSASGTQLTGGGGVGYVGISGQTDPTNYTGAAGGHGYAVLVFYSAKFFPFAFRPGQTSVSASPSISSIPGTFRVPLVSTIDRDSIRTTTFLVKKTGDAAFTRLTGTLAADGSSVSLDMPNLEKGATYEYTLEVTTVDGITFTSSSYTYYVPHTLSITGATVSDRTGSGGTVVVTFSTSATTNAGITGKIQYKVGGAYTDVSGTGTISGTSSYTNTITGVSPNTVVTYRAVLTLGSQDPVTSPEYTFTTRHALTFTGTPTVSGTTLSATGVTIGYSGATGTPTGRVQYRLASTDPSAPYTTVGTNGTITAGSTAGTGTFTQTITGLVPQTTYNVRIQMTISGDVFESSVTDLTTLSHTVTFGTPTFVTTSGSFTSGTITYTFTSTATSADLFTSKLLEYRDVGSSGAYTQVTTGVLTKGTTTGTNTSYTFSILLSSLAANVSYEYKPTLRIGSITFIPSSPNSTFIIQQPYFTASMGTFAQSTARINAAYNQGSYPSLLAGQTIGVFVGYKLATATTYPANQYVRADGSGANLANLTANTNYTYEVLGQVYDTSGNELLAIRAPTGLPTISGSFKTLPHTVTFGTATVSALAQTRATVSFPFTSSADITSAKLQYRKNTDGVFQDVSGAYTGTNTGYTHTTSLTGLTDNTDYTYRVVVNLAGLTFTSNDSTFKTQPYTLTVLTTTKDATVGNITATNATFTLQFQTTSDAPIVNLTCNSATTNYTRRSDVSTITFDSTSNTYTYTVSITTLTAGTDYTYFFNVSAGTTTRRVGDFTFSTPSLFTASVSNILPNSASFTVTYNSGAYNGVPSDRVTPGISYRIKGTPTWTTFYTSTSNVISVNALTPDTLYEYTPMGNVYTTSVKTGTPTVIGRDVIAEFTTQQILIGWSLTSLPTATNITSTGATVTFTFNVNTQITSSNITFGYKTGSAQTYTFPTITPTITLTSSTANLFNYTASVTFTGLMQNTNYISILNVFNVPSPNTISFTTSVTLNLQLVSINHNMNNTTPGFNYAMKIVTGDIIQNGDTIRIRYYIGTLTTPLYIESSSITVTPISNGIKLIFSIPNLPYSTSFKFGLMLTRGGVEALIGSESTFVTMGEIAHTTGINNVVTNLKSVIISLTPTSITLGVGVTEPNRYSNGIEVKLNGNTTASVTTTTVDTLTAYPYRFTFNLLTPNTINNYVVIGKTILVNVLTNITNFRTLPALTEPFANPPREHGTGVQLTTRPVEPLFTFGASLWEVFGM